LKAALVEAVQPYGDLSDNQFSHKTAPPTIVLPADLAYRFHVASQSSSFKDTCSTSASRFGQDLKEYAKDTLSETLKKIEGKNMVDTHPQCVKEEEQGHLSVHVFVTPVETVPRPLHMLPVQMRDKKARRRDYSSQGGHPISNLSLRLRNEGKVLWPMNRILEETNLSEPKESEERTLLSDVPTPTCPFEFHVVVWRRAFYVKACYTKTRRDVSQTPFFVAEQGKRRKLGVTSVEEEILPAISNKCGGISTLNNDKTSDRLIFGMVKFHASGREDLDVRMLLPDPDNLPDNAGRITGRPFVCEIIDALRLPPVESLSEIVNEINHTTADDCEPEPRSYGVNPLGVCISPDFNFVPAKSFANLQAETENKVKYYGCLCWSKDPLPDQDKLSSRLGTFPLELQQRTPIRVLHRRNNVIRVRHVLTCKANRIDDHYFRLHISTDAGTYVKEFVHGDLGRTIPSVGLLLGCKTDILDLDCEGIHAS
jgi:tRNA pseudouridine(54/55) synthase